LIALNPPQEAFAQVNLVLIDGLAKPGEVIGRHQFNRQVRLALLVEHLPHGFSGFIDDERWLGGDGLLVAEPMVWPALARISSSDHCLPL
jgi:hypothetical protein